MVHRIYNNMSRATTIHSVWIATPDIEIINYAESHGLNCVLTSSTHERCTDRCNEALSVISAKLSQSFDSIVMVQGDEPLIQSKSIDALVEMHNSDNSLNIIQLVSKITSPDVMNNPNIIKIVLSPKGTVLYMSRSPIPSNNVFTSSNSYKQVCAMFFTRELLNTFSLLQPSTLEVVESVDFLRLIENSIPIYTKEISYVTHPVDVLSDVQVVESLLG